MTQSKEFFETTKLATPLVVGQLGQILYAVIDSMMVGHLGTVPLAALAFSSNIGSIPLIFCLGVTMSVATYIAQAKGSTDRKSAGEILVSGLYFNTALALVVAGLLHLGAPLLKYFGAPEEVVFASFDYFILFAWSIVPATVFAVFRQFSEGLGKTIFPMVVIIFSLGLNAFFNWLLIFGYWGFPEMGVSGAGLSTLLTRAFMAGLMIAVVFWDKDCRAFIPTSWAFPKTFLIIKKLAHVGIPSGTQYLFEVSAFGLAAIMMGWISAEALAAHQIAINLASITFMVSLGLSFAATIRVGQAVGRADTQGVRSAGFSAVQVGLVFTGFSALIFFMYRDVLPTWYIEDPSVIELASLFLLVAAIFQLADGTQAISSGALRGLPDIKVPVAITFLAYWIFSLPLGYLLAFEFELGGLGIWVALAVGLATSAILMTVRFDRLTKSIPPN